MAAKRAIRTFPASADLWEKTDQWANLTGFKQIGREGDYAVYSKGAGFFTAPRKLSMAVKDGTATLEAWVASGLFVRILALFILPAEITIESGGMTAVLPRKQGRTDVNKLMQLLGQPEIT